jgi:hypothetical protein
MNILASLKRRRADRRAERRAKAQSNEIDRQLQEESKHRSMGQRQQHDILLVGSCFLFRAFDGPLALCGLTVVGSTGTPGSEAEAFAIVKHMQIIHDDCLSEQLLTEFRSVIWKILLENARNIVQILQRLNLDHVNYTTKVRSFNLLLSLSLVMVKRVVSLQTNCEYIMNHRCDTDNPEFLFLPGFAQVVQDLWTEEIIPLLLDGPFSLGLADNSE